jgi:hypothetical protein
VGEARKFKTMTSGRVDGEELVVHVDVYMPAGSEVGAVRVGIAP